MGLGCDQDAVLDYIGYPRVAGLAFNTMRWSEANLFYAEMTDDVKAALGDSGVDDDIAYYLTRNTLGKIDPGRKSTLMDLKRGWGSPTMLSVDCGRMGVRTGDEVSCAIYNDLRAARPNKWSVSITYTDGTSATMSSGINDRDISESPAGRAENSYLDNGRVIIPPPPGWPPIFYKLKSFDSGASGMGARIE